jgi:hypothetical protein
MNRDIPRRCSEGRHHDFKSADGGGRAPLDLILMRPADDLVPAAIGQHFAPRSAVAKGEWDAEGAGDRPARLSGIKGGQPKLEVAGEMPLAVIERAGWIVPHEFWHSGLNLGRKDLGP